MVGRVRKDCDTRNDWLAQWSVPIRCASFFLLCCGGLGRLLCAQSEPWWNGCKWLGVPHRPPFGTPSRRRCDGWAARWNSCVASPAIPLLARVSITTFSLTIELGGVRTEVGGCHAVRGRALPILLTLDSQRLAVALVFAEELDVYQPLLRIQSRWKGREGAQDL